MSYVRANNRSRAGFSLIEVLIAILILGLGMLGLAAVFPVVIAEQRNAVDTVEGEAAIGTAEAILRDFDFPDGWFTTDPLASGVAFGKSDPMDTYFSYEWVAWPFAPHDSVDEGVPGYGPNGLVDGTWYVDLDDLSDINADPTAFDKAITLSERLIPQPYSGRDPQYVWDVVARRRPGARLPQLAIFVRRIDARIRVPEESTLSDVLLQAQNISGGGFTDPVLPIAIDGTNGRNTVDDGVNPNFVYAAPQSLRVQVFKNRPDWLIFENADDPGFDSSIAFATRPGQLLVDNTGTVRRVLESVSDGDIRDVGDQIRAVRVYPPFQPSHGAVRFDGPGDYNENSNDPVEGDSAFEAQRASWVRQVIFTPRTPVSVRVIDLEEPS